MAPMPDALLRACIDTFDCDFYLAFGQTEMSPVTTIFRPEHQLCHAGAVGTQIVNVQIGIMAPDGTLLPRGEEGEIVYRGPQALNGYLKNPRRPRRRSRTAGSTPATRACSPRTACSGSATGTRTSSRPAARTSPRSRSRRPSTPRTTDIAEVGGRRPAAPALDRGDHGGRRAEARQALDEAAAARRDAQQHRRLQGAEGGHRRRRVAQDLDRQDPEERGAQAVRRLLRRQINRPLASGVDDLALAASLVRDGRCARRRGCARGPDAPSTRPRSRTSCPPPTTPPRS